jgi:RHS repeat-associated protein
MSLSGYCSALSFGPSIIVPGETKERGANRPSDSSRPDLTSLWAWCAYARQEGTDLYYYRARYYDPARSRFVSPDPIGFRGGLNLYEYTSSRPLNYTDPLGLARIGSRPLDSKQIPFNGDWRLRHDQIWYDDGQNSGFFDDDTIRSDRVFPRDAYDFRRDPRYYDDALMREAEQSILRYWDMDWRLLDNNCQDYADAVRDKYERLKRERELRKLMK